MSNLSKPVSMNLTDRIERTIQFTECNNTVDLLRECEEEISKLRAALEFYGNPDNWKSGGWDHQFRMMSPEPVYIDKGDKARAALGGDA